MDMADIQERFIFFAMLELTKWGGTITIMPSPRKNYTLVKAELEGREASVEIFRDTTSESAETLGNALFLFIHKLLAAIRGGVRPSGTLVEDEYLHPKDLGGEYRYVDGPVVVIPKIKKRSRVAKKT